MIELVEKDTRSYSNCITHVQEAKDQICYVETSKL